MDLNISSVGQGEPLLFLHGFGFNQQCFSDLTKVLAKSYQCILIDLPGFGLSPYVPYSLDELLNSLHDLLPTQLNILGWSLGGTIALAYAQRYQTNINKLILVCSNPLFIANNDWSGMLASDFKGFLNLIDINFSKAMTTFLALQFPKKNIDKKLLLKLKKLSNNKFLTKSAALNALNILEAQDLCQVFKGLKIPSLTILGQDDQLVPVQLFKNLKSLNKQYNNIFICNRSAHIPFISQQKLFIKLVTDFLELKQNGS